MDLPEHNANAAANDQHEESAAEENDGQGQAETLRVGLVTIRKDMRDDTGVTTRVNYT